MSKFIFEAKEKPNFNITGKIDIKSFDKTGIHESLSGLIRLENQISQEYANALRTDEKLVGQEKASLLRLISMLMTEIITFRLYLEHKSNNNHIIRCANGKSGYDFHISKNGYHFNLTGIFSNKDLNELKSFQQWHESMHSSIHDNLLEKIKLTLADRNMSKNESIEISSQLEEILHKTILIYYKLDSENLFV